MATSVGNNTGFEPVPTQEPAADGNPAIDERVAIAVAERLPQVNQNSRPRNIKCEIRGIALATVLSVVCFYRGAVSDSFWFFGGGFFAGKALQMTGHVVLYRCRNRPGHGQAQGQV